MLPSPVLLVGSQYFDLSRYIFFFQVPSLPANFGVKKLLSGEPASPLVNDTMSVASGYSTVTGTVIGPSVIARLVVFDKPI